MTKLVKESIKKTPREIFSDQIQKWQRGLFRDMNDEELQEFGRLMAMFWEDYK
jgi:hypothetical protein